MECGGLHEASLALRKHEKCIITRVMQGRLLMPLVLWVTRNTSSEKEVANESSTRQSLPTPYLHAPFNKLHEAQDSGSRQIIPHC